MDTYTITCTSCESEIEITEPMSASHGGTTTCPECGTLNSWNSPAGVRTIKRPN